MTRLKARLKAVSEFRARAAVLAMDDPEIADHLDAGRLSALTGQGELDEPDGCFLRIVPNGRIPPTASACRVLAVARDPLHVGARSIDPSLA